FSMLFNARHQFCLRPCFDGEFFAPEHLSALGFHCAAPCSLFIIPNKGVPPESVAPPSRYRIGQASVEDPLFGVLIVAFPPVIDVGTQSRRREYRRETIDVVAELVVERRV